VRAIGGRLRIRAFWGKVPRMRATPGRVESSILHGLLAGVLSCAAPLSSTAPAGPGPRGPTSEGPPTGPEFTAELLSAPRRMLRSATTSEVYELLLHNRGAAPLRIAGLDILGPVQPVLSWTADTLAQDIAILEPDTARASGLRREAVTADGGSGMVELPAGRDAVLYVWIDQGEGVLAPERLVHRLRVVEGGRELERIVEATVDPADPRTIAAPLRGGGWFTANAPAARSSHRRALFHLEGGYFLAQRFAVDLVRVSEQGKTFTGDPTENKSYHAWGAEVLAVGDGVVREVHDGVPENTPGGCQRPMDPDAACERKSAVKMTAQKLTGNTVVLELGPQAFLIYAHLQPGSITVKVGDRVATGQVLGMVGNSGHSTEPHLHIHLCDRASVLACQGVPFGFESFVEQPIDVRKGPVGAPALRRAAMPVDSALVHFPPFPPR